MNPNLHAELSRLRVDDLLREAGRARVRRRRAKTRRPAPRGESVAN